MPAAPLIPATLAFADNVPFAEAYGDVYHSSDGGPGQARHVYLGGNDLPPRWRGRDRFVIAETGFGLGLNFLTTWQAWRDDPDRPARLHYFAIEKHPFTAADLARLHAAWPALAPLSASLLRAWPPLTPGFHRLLLEDGRIVLTLAFGDIADCLPQIDAAADAFYLDGFSPAKNPDMWSPQVLSRLNRLAAPDATAASYTVSAAVRRALTQAGFHCEKRPGFGRKAEMLHARFAPRWMAPAAGRAIDDRRAIVIGAGLAGAAACERLAARGWRITLLERHAQPAQGASGNLAGIVMPLISKDDNPASRLARAAYLFALHTWRRLDARTPVAGEANGVLQLVGSADEAAAQAAAARLLCYPEDYARWLDAPAAAALLAGGPLHGGWLFPQGGWLHPESLCRAMLEHAGDKLDAHYDTAAAAIERADGQWRVLDPAGACLAEAPVLILANGMEASDFSQAACLPLSPIRGQVTHVEAGRVPVLPLTVCGDGYITRAHRGMVCIGATYDFDADTRLRQDSQTQNLARLSGMLPHVAAALTPPDTLAGRVGFRCVTPDRLPLVGALPDPASRIAGSRLRDVPRLPGLYGLLGYGSRGLIWASFAAELLAATLEGEPLPVERDLAVALDPARFVLKAHRKRMDKSVSKP